MLTPFTVGTILAEENKEYLTDTVSDPWLYFAIDMGMWANCMAIMIREDHFLSALAGYNKSLEFCNGL